MDAQKHGRTSSFTMIELMVVVGIIIILAGLLLPALAYVRGQAHIASCMSNIRQIGVAMRSFESRNESYPPTGNSSGEVFNALLDGYLDSREVLNCPGEAVSYVFTGSPTEISYYVDFTMPYSRHNMRAVAADRTAREAENRTPAWSLNHGTGVNVLFNDGHVEFLTPVDDRIWNPHIEGDNIYAATGDSLTGEWHRDHAWIRWDRAASPDGEGDTGGPGGPSRPNISWTGFIDDPATPDNPWHFRGYMSVYQTTNNDYLAYLNAALAAGDITIVGDEVVSIGERFHGEAFYRLTQGEILQHEEGFRIRSGYENHPVRGLRHRNWVTARGAVLFAEHYGWRIPTLEEWRAVANYTDNRPYPTGDFVRIEATPENLAAIMEAHPESHPREQDGYYYLANYADYSVPWGSGTTEVGHFGYFGFGLADMAGNVVDSIVSGSCNHQYVGGAFDQGAYGVEEIIRPGDQQRGFRVVSDTPP